MGLVFMFLQISFVIGCTLAIYQYPSRTSRDGIVFVHLRFFSVSPLESGSLLVCDRVHHSQSFYFIGSGLAACSTSTCVRNSSGYLHVLKMGNSVRVPHSCLVDGRVFDTCCD